MSKILSIAMLMSSMIAGDALADFDKDGNWQRPDRWDCVMSTGKMSEPGYCNKTNLCLDNSSWFCRDNVKAAKGDREAQGKMEGCFQNKMLQCMRMPTTD